MQVFISKDGEGYLAKMENHPNIFAWGKTESEAEGELVNVIEMINIVNSK